MFPAELKGICVAVEELALQQQLGDDAAHIERVGDQPCLGTGIAPQSVEIDRTLIGSLGDRSIVAVLPIEALDSDHVVGVGRRRPHNVAADRR